MSLSDMRQFRAANFEVLTEDALVGDGGNPWGGHQCRVVRTKDGVFTAYTTLREDLSKEWRLLWLQDGHWREAARGLSGREPVNLLASPDGTIHIIAWTRYVGTLWSGKPDGGKIEMSKQTIPGVAGGSHPYSSAGIDDAGNICVLSSTGYFRWSYLPAETGAWRFFTTKTPWRFCYTYIFPERDGSLSLVSTRDVTWGSLGYKQPAGSFDYVFNAYGYWYGSDFSQSLDMVAFREEPPIDEWIAVFCNAQSDAYLDTKGRMHIIYRLRGKSTNGGNQVRHAVYTKKGRRLFDGMIPEEAGVFCRIFQDDRGRYFLLGSAGMIYPMGRNGINLKAPVRLDLKGHDVEYSGFGISVPRTGTPLAGVMDVVFPSDGGKKWIYFRLELGE